MGKALRGGTFCSCRKYPKTRLGGGISISPLLRTTPLKRPNTRGAEAPLIGCIPRGNETCKPLRPYGSSHERPRRAEGKGRPTAQGQARLWTQLSHVTRPGSGSGCWGAGVCKLRAPGLGGLHPRQTRGNAKGRSPLPAFFWVGHPAQAQRQRAVWGEEPQRSD